MPILSVILPVRNGAEYVGSAVRSCLQGIPYNSEVVVLDDNSTDHTWDVLCGIKDSRLRLLRRTSGSGLAGALNELIDQTDGRFIARMDADDVSLPWRFSRQVSALENGADFCFGSVIHKGPATLKVRPSRLDAIDGEALNLLLLLENPVAHSTAMFQRSAIEKLSGYRDVASEDYDLWLRAARDRFEIKKLRAPLLIYRHHPGQVTQDGSWIQKSRVQPMLSEAHRSLMQELLNEDYDCISGLRETNASIGQKEYAIDLVSAIELKVKNGISGAGVRRLLRTCKRIRYGLSL